MRAKKTVNGNRVGEDEEKKENKELSLGERRKKGKGEEVRMGVARRGMAIMLGKIRGNKKEMTAGRSVLLRRVLQYLRKSTGKNKSVRKRKLPNFS